MAFNPYSYDDLNLQDTREANLDQEFVYAQF